MESWELIYLRLCLHILAAAWCEINTIPCNEGSICISPGGCEDHTASPASSSLVGFGSGQWNLIKCFGSDH